MAKLTNGYIGNIHTVLLKNWRIDWNELAHQHHAKVLQLKMKQDKKSTQKTTYNQKNSISIAILKFNHFTGPRNGW